MTIADMIATVGECSLLGYEFQVIDDTRGSIYLRAKYLDADTDTGRMEYQFTRRWLLSPQMLPDEVVQTAFKCGPKIGLPFQRNHSRVRCSIEVMAHFKLQKLWELCEAGEFVRREEPVKK